MKADMHAQPIQDRTFGTLEWRRFNDWVRETVLPGFGNATLVVELREDEAIESQRQQYIAFISGLPGLHSIAGDLLFEDYLRRQQLFRATTSEDLWRDDFPDLRNRAGIWMLLHNLEVIIPWPTDYQDACVILAWEAEYDPEHGIRIIVKNGACLSLD